ncbi:MAG: hypothetical protein Q7R95_06195 [bacterium]|nr:hypothetical protein [bacterium]
MEQDNKKNQGLKADGKNPINNIGAIFERPNARGSYYILKASLDGKNYTMVAFPNRNHSGEEFSKEPLYYIFPYTPKNKDVNGNNKN